MIVIYPWMPKELNPNARVHWRVKHNKAMEYKNACYVLTMQGKLPKVVDDRLHLSLEFFKPNRMRRDIDNALASFKYGLDGISKAIGLDDSRFIISMEFSEQIGGYVKVKFNF